jgi:hypothetical protein
MSAQEASIAAKRRAQLQAIAERYFDALRGKDFSAIPYDDRVTLRAPLTPNGVNQPLVGKEALRIQWWQSLEPALEGVQITVVDPPATLRVADRFTVDEDGRIVEQENHFDPRDVTNPGWQRGS